MEKHIAPYLKRMLDGRPAILMDEGMALWRCLRGFVEDVAAAIALAVTSQAAANRVYNFDEPTAYNEADPG
jgi:nucleoside-diphosphate-sugar epimerase